MQPTTVEVVFVRDLQRTHRFYTALGFVLKEEVHEKGPIHYSVAFGGMIVEFYPAKSTLVAPPPTKSRLLIVEVDNFDHVLQTCSAMEPNASRSTTTIGSTIFVPCASMIPMTGTYAFSKSLRTSSRRSIDRRFFHCYGQRVLTDMEVSMPFQPSTPEELQRSEDQVREVLSLIRRLRAEGKDVHLIWDVDRVLVSGRSDDAFAYLGFDVSRYFTHEERLFTNALEDGPFVKLARKCGEDGMHQTQDIVTARSSFLGLRVIFFLLFNWPININWMLQVGHQSKKDSYRIILEACRKNEKMHVISVDDAKKHNVDFDAAAAELGMSDRCHSILAHPVRNYTEEELRHEIDAVMAAEGSRPIFVETFDTSTGQRKRCVQVTPAARDTMRSMLHMISQRIHVQATVDRLREPLEAFARREMPDEPITDDLLYTVFNTLREPR